MKCFLLFVLFLRSSQACLFCEECYPNGTRTVSYCIACREGYQAQAGLSPIQNWNKCVCNGCPESPVPFPTGTNQSDPTTQWYRAVPWPVDSNIPGAAVIGMLKTHPEFRQNIQQIPWRGVGLCDEFMTALNQAGPGYNKTPIERAAETQCLKQRIYIVGLNKLFGFDWFTLPLELATSVESWLRLGFDLIRGLFILFSHSDQEGSPDVWEELMEQGIDPFLVFRVVNLTLEATGWLSAHGDWSKTIGAVRSAAQATFAPTAKTNPLSQLTLESIHGVAHIINTGHAATRRVLESPMWTRKISLPPLNITRFVRAKSQRIATKIVGKTPSFSPEPPANQTAVSVRNSNPDPRKLLEDVLEHCRIADLFVVKTRDVFAIMGQYYTEIFPRTVQNFHQFLLDIGIAVENDFSFQPPPELAQQVAIVQGGTPPPLPTAQNASDYYTNFTSQLNQIETKGVIGMFASLFQTVGMDIIPILDQLVEKIITQLQSLSFDLCPYERVMTCADKRPINSAIAGTIAFLFIATAICTMFFPMFMPIIFIAWALFVFISAFAAYGYTPFCLPMLPTCLADDLFEYIFRPFIGGNSYWLSSFFRKEYENLPEQTYYDSSVFIRCSAPPYGFYDGINTVVFFIQWNSPATFSQMQKGTGLWSWTRDIPIFNESIQTYQDFHQLPPDEQQRFTACFTITILLASSFIIVISVVGLAGYSAANMVVSVLLTLIQFIDTTLTLLTTAIAFYDPRNLEFKQKTQKKDDEEWTTSGPGEEKKE